MYLTYKNPVYPYQKSADQISGTTAHHALIVVGAGPVGMSAAIDAAQQGMDVLVLDDNNTVSVGSRAVCYSKRALEILGRLKCADRMIEKGVLWNVGKVFFKDELVSQFDLLAEEGHKTPAFINLQQYYLEEYMVDRMSELDQLEVRWKNKVIDVQQDVDSVQLTIATPDGEYQLSCDWLIVADGANSGVRQSLGLQSSGKVFEDRFLIADIVMKAGFPSERWFNFDPSYHRGYSTLLHKQPDNLWRLDFQLGWDADPAEEKKPENIIPRVKAMMGEDTEFELEWASVYTFQCRRMEKFRHERVLFVGDAAHQVSPFGARGANSGIQDTDNLIWKLKLVMTGKAADSLLDSYSEERVFAADENLLNSTRSTDFITPKSKASKRFRDATLSLSKDFLFAQKLTNSGRLSDPSILSSSSLITSDEDHFDCDLVPGAAMCDAPVKSCGISSKDTKVNHTDDGWLLGWLDSGFKLLYFIGEDTILAKESRNLIKSLKLNIVGVEVIMVGRNVSHSALDFSTLAGTTLIDDEQGLLHTRCDAQDGTGYLIRPDQHLAARWRSIDLNKVMAAVDKSIT